MGRLPKSAPCIEDPSHGYFLTGALEAAFAWAKLASVAVRTARSMGWTEHVHSRGSISGRRVGASLISQHRSGNSVEPAALSQPPVYGRQTRRRARIHNARTWGERTDAAKLFTACRRPRRRL
ncbi:hypothetical protein MTO96_010348 [Rhipicephalus appendiculatus]